MLETLSRSNQFSQIPVKLDSEQVKIAAFPSASPVLPVSDLSVTKFEYQVGGSLPANAPTYVTREADRELYASLMAGEFCYVLTSRQMGKSSLRVQTARRLQAAGTVCGTVDITGIGTAQMTATQWYAGFTSTLANSFKIKMNVSNWWRDRDNLPPVLRLNEFIEQVLLPAFNGNLVIFIDEIDSLLSLDFATDDFFAMLRGCYNKRAENPEYNRLTFALFGVTTPADLIADRTRTPFNIGRAIELQGFDLESAKPLARGLTQQVENSLDLLTEILNWTGGQPFLTQKICQLATEKLQTQNQSDRPVNCQEFIAELVRSCAIENWEFQDEPEHLKTIRDRLLVNSQRTARLLGVYQQILIGFATDLPAEADIDALSENSSEIRELMLSGLIVKNRGKLRIYNPIYAAVFDRNWIQQELAKLRPYSESIAAWEASNRTDNSRLLQGNALAEALAWAADKSLGDRDYQFLSASQELENLEIQRALEIEKSASKILADANAVLAAAQQKAKRTVQLSLCALAAISAIAGAIVIRAQQVVLQIENQKTAAIIAQIAAFNSTAEISLDSDRLGALVAAVSAGKKLAEIEVSPELKQQTAKILYRTLDGMRERNRLPEGHTASLSPDGKLIVSTDDTHAVKVFQPNGKLILTLPGHRNLITEVRFSPDSQLIAATSFDRTVRIWRRDGTLLQILQGHRDLVWSVSFSPNSELIATSSSDKTIKIWNQNGNLLQTLTGHTKPVTSVRFSPDGKMLVSASQDKTLKLWKRQGTRQFRFDKTLSGHADEVWGCNFAPDGKTIASASHDWTVKLWNAEGKLLRTLDDSQAGVATVNWSSDSRTLAGGDTDGQVMLWRADGTLLQTFKAHQADVWSLSFSPDRATLVSAGKDASVKLWSLDAASPKTAEIDKLLILGCRWLDDYLQYNPDVSNSRHLCDNPGN
ncbi:MAG: AAA-like domain-containing protein [Microcoleus sp.]